MMQKVQRGGFSTESSALKDLDPSTLPTKLLELGTKIVQDLGLDYSVDTLSRWMSHHLAEKMIQLESLEGDEKDKVEKEVVELIETLWANKHNWPSGVTPLNQYNELQNILTRLGPNASPFNSHRADENEKLLAAIFFGLKQTVINGAILISDNRKLPENLNASLDVFDNYEKLYIETIKSWVELSIKRPTGKNSYELFLEGNISLSDEEIEELSEDKIIELISSDIDRLMEDLQKFKLKISESSLTQS